MSPRLLALVLSVAAAALGSCREPSGSAAPEPAARAASAPQEPSAPAAGEVAAAAVAAAQPVPASLLPLVLEAAAAEPGGPAALAAGGETIVDPAATFSVVLGAPVRDVRLVLLDASDAHVAASGGLELGPSTTLTLSPAAPLAPGSRYVLRIEGAATRELHDESGAPFAPLSFPILAAGTPPALEAKPRSRRR